MPEQIIELDSLYKTDDEIIRAMQELNKAFFKHFDELESFFQKVIGEFAKNNIDITTEQLNEIVELMPEDNRAKNKELIRWATIKQQKARLRQSKNMLPEYDD